MVNQGILQAQLKVKNSMNLENGFIDNPLLKSVEGEINLTDENSFKGFASNTAIEHLDTIKSSSQNAIDLTNSLNNLSNLKYAKLEGNFNSNVEGKFSGNTAMQKLDLSQDITIKPNDLAENESLRELPKLDYSNPDLTDIITNDTNLKPTIIDLSNQNNTNKLGIHGDSTHQLGNLEFVKVNTEAPFNNQITPQIDVSYTSLDRNGLVNLFNTMPYNVGYTTVGTPTIVDNVASGFSTSNYLTLPTLTATAGNPFEMQIAFTAYSTTANALNIYFNPSYRGRFGVFSSNRPVFRFQNTGLTTYTQVAFDTVISMNTKYTAKAVYNGTTVNAYLYNASGTLLETKTTTADLELEGPTNLGATSSNYWDGSIDLNETYIKVNSIVSTGPVNYTVVGSPTITDGVASGFSGSKYLPISAPFVLNSSTVADFIFKVRKNSYEVCAICGEPDAYSMNFVIDNTGKLFIALGNGTSWNIINSGQGTTQLQQSVWYYVKLSINNQNVSMHLSTDGITYNQEFSRDVTISSEYTYNLCIARARTSAQYFHGYIDLKESYIKVNGELWFGHESKMVTWFNGQPSMSKTIDITSAAGTNSLTNDDKAIVTNKGWTITGV